MAGLTAAIFGATGATGKHLLRGLLSSDSISKVSEYGRSTTKTENLSSATKLEQQTVDFDKLEIKDGGWDVVYIVLGTSRKAAGSAEAFERIDREYVLSAAKAAKSNDPSRKQRLVYLSSVGANPTAFLLYSKSKGLTEQALATLGYDDVIVMRPSFLSQAERTGSRPFESVALSITHYLAKVSDSFEIPVPTLAQSIRIAGELGTAGLPDDVKKTTSWGGKSFTVIDNAGCIKLAQRQ